MRSIKKYCQLIPELLLAMGLVGFACATQARAATESDTLKVKDGTNALVVNFSTLDAG